MRTARSIFRVTQLPALLPGGSTVVTGARLGAGLLKTGGLGRAVALGLAVLAAPAWISSADAAALHVGQDRPPAAFSAPAAAVPTPPAGGQCSPLLASSDVIPSAMSVDDLWIAVGNWSGQGIDVLAQAQRKLAELLNLCVPAVIGIEVEPVNGQFIRGNRVNVRVFQYEETRDGGGTEVIVQTERTMTAELPAPTPKPPLSAADFVALLGQGEAGPIGANWDRIRATLAKALGYSHEHEIVLVKDPSSNAYLREGKGYAAARKADGPWEPILIDAAAGRVSKGVDAPAPRSAEDNARLNLHDMLQRENRGYNDVFEVRFNLTGDLEVRDSVGSAPRASSEWVALSPAMFTLEVGVDPSTGLLTPRQLTEVLLDDARRDLNAELIGSTVKVRLGLSREHEVQLSGREGNLFYASDNPEGAWWAQTPVAIDLRTGAMRRGAEVNPPKEAVVRAEERFKRFLSEHRLDVADVEWVRFGLGPGIAVNVLPHVNTPTLGPAYTGPARGDPKPQMFWELPIRRD